MTYEEKKAWLSRYRKAMEDARRLNDQIAQVQTVATHTTQTLSPVPGGGGDGQNLARAIEHKAALEQEADALRQRREQYYKEIFDALTRCVHDTIDYQIMHRRYLECQAWEKIAADMNFAPRWVYARHHRAVDETEPEKHITIQITVPGVK